MGVLDAPGLTQVQADSKYASVFGAAAQDERTLPTFTRYSGNPVFSLVAQNPAAGKTPAPSIYWPYLVHAKAISSLTSTALDEWYLYYTTDHDPGYGGVYLATGPSPLGPWTSRGLVFQNQNIAGAQTENASVIWDEDIAAFRMFVKVFYASGMKTNLVTSPDGITWTDLGNVAQPPAAQLYPGNYQAGYFRPFRVGRQWHAHFMVGGGDLPIFALAHSHNGAVWQIEGRALGYGSDQLSDAPGAVAPLAQNGLRVEWNSGDVVWWRGQWWWFGIVSNFTSGNAAKNARLGCAPISDDFRNLLGPVQYILQNPTGANESTNYRACRAHVYQGRVYLYYQCDTYFNVAVSN